MTVLQSLRLLGSCCILCTSCTERVVLCVDDEFVAFNQFSSVSDPDSPPVDVDSYSNKTYGVTVAGTSGHTGMLKGVYRTWKVTADFTKRLRVFCSYGASRFLCHIIFTFLYTVAQKSPHFFSYIYIRNFWHYPSYYNRWVAGWRKWRPHLFFYTRQLYRQVLLRARISYGNSVCPSVCPSVRHDPVRIQNQVI